MGLKTFLANAPTATYGSFALYRNNELRRITGDDPGRHSLAGATVELSTGSDLQKRVTLTRVLAVGVFALALKKKRGGEMFLLINGPHFTWLEEVPAKKVTAARRFAAQVEAAILKANKEANHG